MKKIVSYLILMLSLILINLSVYKFSYARDNEINLDINNNIIYFADKKLFVDIANNQELRSKGLMYVKSMPYNYGMLFIFEYADIHCFWMKNTYIPLSIAFLDENKAIVDIFDMQPLSEAPICPSKPIKYAIEVNKGWFKFNNSYPIK